MARYLMDAAFGGHHQNQRVFRRDLFEHQPFDIYTDEEPRAQYRFGRRSIEYLEQLLGEDLL